MRLAIVSEGFSPYIGGVETRYTELASKLAQKHEISILTILKDDNDGFDPPWKERIDGITVHRLPQTGEYFLADGTRSARGLAGFLARALSEMGGRDFDAVICSEWPLAHVPPVALLRNSLCVVDWHEVWGRYYLSFGMKGLIGYLLERAVARMPRLKHVAVSNFTKSRLVSHLGVPSPHVAVIPSGVNTRAFDALNVKKEEGQLIYFGRFMPHKHIEWLIEAFERLVRSEPELSLRIIGDGPLRKSLEERTRGADGIEILGPLTREKLIRELKAAWIAAIPSVREGQGISYLEAMAAGTPVVAVQSPLSAVRELIENDRNGLIVEASPQGLIRGITSFLRDRDLWSRISEAGRRTALCYDWDECATRFNDLLEDGVNGKG